MTVQAMITYARALHKNGDLTKAASVAQALPDGSSISNENGFYIASIYVARGQKEIGKKMLQSILATKRPFPMKEQADALLAELSSN